MTHVVPAPNGPEPVSPWRRWSVLVSRAITFLVYVYVIAVEIILLLGFVLLLLGANPSSSFVEWVYRSLDRTMAPFRGIFEPIELGVTSNEVPSILETSVLFAMIVYGIVAVVVHTLLMWINSRFERIERTEDELRRHQALTQAMIAAQQAAPQTAAMAADPTAGPMGSSTPPPAPPAH